MSRCFLRVTFILFLLLSLPWLGHADPVYVNPFNGALSSTPISRTVSDSFSFFIQADPGHDIKVYFEGTIPDDSNYAYISGDLGGEGRWGYIYWTQASPKPLLKTLIQDIDEDSEFFFNSYHAVGANVSLRIVKIELVPDQVLAHITDLTTNSYQVLVSSGFSPGISFTATTDEAAQVDFKVYDSNWNDVYSSSISTQESTSDRHFARGSWNGRTSNGYVPGWYRVSASVNDGEEWQIEFEIKTSADQLTGIGNGSDDLDPLNQIDLNIDDDLPLTFDPNLAQDSQWANSFPIDDPVNVLSGDFIVPEKDLTLKSRLPLVLARFYNSLDASSSPFGRGWSSPLCVRLEFVDSDILFVNFDGSRLLFREQNGEFVSTSGSALKITSTNNGWSMKNPRGGEWLFNSTGAVTAISFGNNPESAIIFAYDDNGFLKKVSNSYDQWFEFSCDENGLIVSATDSSGRTVSYAYENGNLTSFTDAIGRTTQYTYDENGYVTQIARPGALITSVSYSNGRVSSVTHPNGQISVFDWSYDPNQLFYVAPNGILHTYRFSPEWRLETYEVSDQQSLSKTKTFVSSGPYLIESCDTQGAKSQYTYSESGLLNSVSDAMGNVSIYEWDPALYRITKQTDPLGREWRYVWNSFGKLASASGPLGHSSVYTYDVFGNCISYVDSLGQTTRYEYSDGGGRLERVIDPTGGIKSFTYDQRGNLLSLTDPLQRVTAFEYDSADRLVKATYPDGRFVELSYDPANNLSIRRDNLGRETKYEYDLDRNLTAIISPDNSRAELAYDSVGQLVSFTDSLGRKTCYDYEPLFGPGKLGKISKITYPDNSCESFKYNSEGWLIERCDELGHITKHEYDVLGRLLATIDATGARWESSYDPVGNRLSSKDPLGHITGFEYDALNRLTKRIKADGSNVCFRFDQNNNLIALTDELNNVWSWKYDPVGRPVNESQPTGASSTFMYDLAGQLRSTINPLGYETKYAFDPSGRLSAMTDPKGNVYRCSYDSLGRLASMTTPIGSVYTYTYSYDDLDRTIAVTDPLGNTIRAEYDKAGQLSAIIDALLRKTALIYDARGRLLSRINPDGGTFSYGYDAAGRQTMVSDAVNRIWRWEHDALGRVVAEFNPLGASQRYSFDSVGNLVARTNARNQTIRYTFDALAQLTQVDYPDMGVATFSYDAAGREVLRSGMYGSMYKTWDSAHNLTSVTFGPWGKKWQYFYDLAGNRIRAIDPENGPYTYTYDSLGLLTRLNPPGPNDAISYVYDQLGRPTEVSYAGIKTCKAYDRTNRLLEIRHLRDHGRDRVIASRKYAYNPVGNLISAIDESGKKTTYSNNAADWLSRVVYPEGLIVDYNYNLAGDRLTETRSAPVVIGHGRNARVGTATSIVPFEYDQDGRLVSQASSSWQYDDDGNVVSKTENGEEIRFVWSSTNRLMKAEKVIECQKHGKRKCSRCPPTSSSEAYGYLPEDWRRVICKTDDQNNFSVYDLEDESHEYKVSSTSPVKAWQFGPWCVKPQRDKLELLRQFVSGPGTDDLEITRYRGHSLVMLKDVVGSTIALANHGGNVVARVNYDAFGNLRWPDKPGHSIAPCREADLDDYLNRLGGKYTFGLPQCDEWHFGRHFGKSLTPYLFTGRRYQPFTEQYFNRNRHYSPKSGRFTSSDPIGFSGGDNLYAYANNNPSRLTDPYGLSAVVTFDAFSSSWEVPAIFQSFMALARQSWAAAGLDFGLSISASALGIGTAGALGAGAITATSLTIPMDTAGTVPLPYLDQPIPMAPLSYPEQLIENQNITAGENPAKNKEFVTEASKGASTIILSQGQGGKLLTGPRAISEATRNVAKSYSDKVLKRGIKDAVQEINRHKEIIKNADPRQIRSITEDLLKHEGRLQSFIEELQRRGVPIEF